VTVWRESAGEHSSGSRREFVLQRIQRQMRRLVQPLLDERAMRIKHRLAVRE
jgi:hypothetical protein